MEAKVAVGRPAWIISESLSGMPTSCAITAAISSMRAPRASAIRFIQLARSSSDVADQLSNAPRAAATARSTSAALASGTLPITSSVVGFTTSIAPLPSGFTHSPPM